MARLLLQLSVTAALVLFCASISQAAECVDDPNECTLKALCEKATSMDAGSTIWSSVAKHKKHVTLAQQLGMDCGVTIVVDPCDTDPAECKVSQICERATTRQTGTLGWDNSADGHVAIAKSYGLNCGVGTGKPAQVESQCISANVKECTDEQVCAKATFFVSSVSEVSSCGTDLRI